MNGNEKCDDNTDNADVDADADGQHDPYVSAMLCRQQKNGHVFVIAVTNSDRSATMKQV